jgi:hypothetical protein
VTWKRTQNIPCSNELGKPVAARILQEVGRKREVFQKEKITSALRLEAKALWTEISLPSESLSLGYWDSERKEAFIG